MKMKESSHPLYSERLLDHFHNPRNAGELPAPAQTVTSVNPACGDELKLSARVESGVIVEARFQARGCTAAIACGSALTVWLSGRAVDELKQAAPEAVAQAVESEAGGLAVESRHAAVLAADAARLLVRRLG